MEDARVRLPQMYIFSPSQEKFNRTINKKYKNYKMMLAAENYYEQRSWNLVFLCFLHVFVLCSR